MHMPEDQMLLEDICMLASIPLAWFGAPPQSQRLWRPHYQRVALVHLDCQAIHSGPGLQMLDACPYLSQTAGEGVGTGQC